MSCKDSRTPGGFFVSEDNTVEERGNSVVATSSIQVSPGCSLCSSLTYNQEWLTVFSVRLCNLCKRQEPLISKAAAKQRYHVSDNDLKKLGSLRKSNPHKKDWQPMHLYMQSQVEAVSHQKHGGREGLEEYSQRLLDQKMQERIKRRESAKRKEDEETARLDRIKRRMQAEDEERLQLQQSLLAQQAGDGEEVEEI